MSAPTSKILSSLLGSWLIGALTFTALSFVSLRINLHLFLINLVTELYPANDPFGTVNQLLIPSIVHLLIGSASFFLALYVFLCIERNGLRFNLKSFLFGIALIAILIGLSVSNREPVSPIKAVIFLVVSFGALIGATFQICHLLHRTNCE